MNERDNYVALFNKTYEMSDKFVRIGEDRATEGILSVHRVLNEVPGTLITVKETCISCQDRHIYAKSIENNPYKDIVEKDIVYPGKFWTLDKMSGFGFKEDVYVYTDDNKCDVSGEIPSALETSNMIAFPEWLIAKHIFGLIKIEDGRSYCTIFGRKDSYFNRTRF